MAKEGSSNRAYLLRCWREGDGTPGNRPRWRFLLEEVLPGRGRQGYADLASLIAFLRASFGPAEAAGDPSKPETGL